MDLKQCRASRVRATTGGGHEGAPLRHRLPALREQDLVDRRREGRPPIPEVHEDLSFRTRAEAMHLIETLGRLVEDLGHLS